MKKIKFFLVAATICACAIVSGIIANNYTSQVVSAHEGHDHSALEKSVFAENPLLVKSRNKYTICVSNESSDKSINTTELVSRVQQEVEGHKKGKKWTEAGLNAFTNEVVIGCSFSPVLKNANSKHPIYSGDIDATNYVTAASPETLAIFIVDQTVIDKHFKNFSNRWSPEQMICQGHECNEVTKGIYLTPDEFKNIKANKLSKELLIGLGMESPIPGPSPNQQADRIKKQAELKK